MQNHLPGARVVKTFNTLLARILAQEPRVGNGKRVLFISGDDKDAKSKVIEIINEMGFAAIDLGTLAGGGRLQQFNWPLNDKDFIKF